MKSEHESINRETWEFFERSIRVRETNTLHWRVRTPHVQVRYISLFRNPAGRVVLILFRFHEGIVRKNPHKRILHLGATPTIEMVMRPE